MLKSYYDTHYMYLKHPAGNYEEKDEETRLKLKKDTKVMREYLFILDEFKSPIPHELYLRIQSNATIVRWNIHLLIWKGCNARLLERLNIVFIFKKEEKEDPVWSV